MRVALLELRRRPGRFAAAGSILFLIAALLLLLGGLSDGLNANRNGIFRTQRAELVVFSTAAERSLPQSLVNAETRGKVAAVPGVEVGSLGIAQLAARVPGRGVRDLVDLVVVGVERGIPQTPERIEPGTAWADRSLEALGVEVGQTIAVGPARSPIRVAGFVEDTGYGGRGTIWMDDVSFRELVTANKPDQVLPDGSQEALLVTLTSGASDAAAVAAQIDAATGGATETITRAEAADAVQDIGGGTLAQIIGMTTVIAAAVVALFFALLTSERAGLYAVFKAIGARDRTLLAGVVAQAVVLTLVGLGIAIPLAVAFDVLVPPDAVPFQLSLVRAITSAVLLLAASAIGAALTVRRVLRIDPAAAIGTAG